MKIKISNPKNNESIILKNVRRIRYPDFYKILITKAVTEKLKLDKNLPILEIVEVKKNKSFVAKKAKIFKEEEKIHNKAPVDTVKIDNISLIKKNQSKITNEKFYIIIAEFYSKESANILKKRIISRIKDVMHVEK